MTDKDTSKAKDRTAPETEQKDSPLQAWIARSEVKRIMQLDPDIIRQEANSDVERRSDTPRQDGGGTMMFARHQKETDT